MALTIMQWNARSLLNNKEQLKNFLFNTPNPPDVVCIEETFLKEKHQSPRINGYDIIRKDRTNKEQGGLAIYIKIGLNFNVLSIQDNKNLEAQGIEIKTIHGHLKIINAYVPGNNVDKEDLAPICNNKRTILVGDFNAHNKMWGCTETRPRGRLLEEIITENRMVVLNTGQATHIISNQSTSNSVIDLSICTQDIALNTRHVVTNSNMGSDHLASITIVNEEITIENNLSMQLWKLKKADWKQYKENSKTMLIDEIIATGNIEEKYKNIVDCLTELANQTIPPKNKTNSKNSKKAKRHKPLPYWNDKCSEAIYKRNQSRNKMIKTKELHDYMEYKQREANAKRIIKIEAKTSWEDYCSNLTHQTKLGSVWGWARRMNGVATYSAIPTLKTADKIAENNLEKANLLAHTYAETSSSNNYDEQFLKHIKNNELEHNPCTAEANGNADTEAINLPFNMNEIKEAIRSTKNNKSPGDDRLPYELIKHLHHNAIKTLLTFYNEIWTEKQFPKEWHHAIILPFLKPNKDATKPDSYRPISLTPTLCKIMEKMVTNRLQWYLENNNLYTKNQTGFRKHKNTLDQIIKLQDNILKKLKNKEHLLAIFIDFERAFDMLHIPTLHRKLQKQGIIGNTAKWIENFLSDRTFQVKVGAELSTKFTQHNGTPQGSVISPLLFLIMINDIPSGPEGVDMSLFADDSAVYTGGRNIKHITSKIQQAMDAIHTWCHENGFKISLNKTTGILFSNKKQIPTINIKIGDKLIKMENKAKFLGIIFDRKLNWRSHVEYIIEKCKKRINLMRAVSGYHWGASKKSLLSIYKALIRSIIDYGDVAYASAPKTILEKLSTIQTEALRICCGAPKGAAALALQNECGETPLHLRRTHNSIKQQIKIMGSREHPCTTTTQQHWTDVIKTRRHKQTSLYQRTHEFLSSLNTPFHGPSFPSSPPWINKEIEIDLSLKEHINKKTDNPEYMKSMATELITNYTSTTHIYTDGSKMENIVSAAFTIPSLNIDKVFRLCNDSSIYAAELTAIKEAIIWIIQNNTNEKFAIFSDSLSVLSSLKEGTCNSRPILFNELITIINTLAPNKIKLIWIPSHVDLTGNERADKLAKEGLGLEAINTTNYLETKEITPLINTYIINKWQLEYDKDEKGNHYKSICPTVSTNNKFTDPCRKKEAQIGRLRLGVSLTNQRLHKLGKHPNGLCDTCLVPDTIDHLLLHCKRQNISSLLQNQCNIYKYEFNLKTLLETGIIQPTVYRLINLINNDKIL